MDTDPRKEIREGRLRRDTLFSHPDVRRVPPDLSRGDTKDTSRTSHSTWGLRVRSRPSPLSSGTDIDDSVGRRVLALTDTPSPTRTRSTTRVHTHTRSPTDGYAPTPTDAHVHTWTRTLRHTHTHPNTLPRLTLQSFFFSGSVCVGFSMTLVFFVNLSLTGTSLRSPALRSYSTHLVLSSLSLVLAIPLLLFASFFSLNRLSRLSRRDGGSTPGESTEAFQVDCHSG